MSGNPHLPNEIWLQILKHTCSEVVAVVVEEEEEAEASTAKTLWLSLRPASSQLKACVEQYFYTSLLLHFRVFLPITLPSYDQRNPLKGHAVFLPRQQEGEEEGLLRDREVWWIKLEGTQPEHYLTQFLTRWEGLKDVGTGFVKDIVWWEVEFGGRRERLKFRDAKVSGNHGEGMEVGLLWQDMLTAFFEKLRWTD